MKILIAEDDSANVKFLSKLLSPHGEVVVADNGMKAVDEFVAALENEDPFDLVCLDIMMPKLDGYKVLEAIRDAEAKQGLDIYSRSKVIMTSALDEGTEIENICQEYDAYICKPIDIHDFERIIKNMGLI